MSAFDWIDGNQMMPDQKVERTCKRCGVTAKVTMRKGKVSAICAACTQKETKWAGMRKR